MTVLRELLARFGIDVDDKAVKKADVTMNGFIGKLKKFGGMVAGGFVANAVRTFIGDQLALSDQIGKTAAKIGVTTDELQELRFAAERTGVAQRTLDMALQKLGVRASEAAIGTGEAKDVFRQLGIQIKDANGQVRPTSDLLRDIADAMAQVPSQADRMRIATKLFEEEGTALVNTLGEGSAALDQLRAAARASGGVIPAEMIAQAEAATDELTAFKGALTGIKSSLILTILPAIRGLTTGTTTVMQKFQELTRGTYFVEAAFGAAAIAAALLGRNSIRAAVAQLIAWAPIIATVALVALGILGVALLVDEVIKTFQGGDTVIRRFVDSIFGVGATESAVNGVKLIVEALTNAFSLLWERASKNLALIRVEFGVLHARGIQLWKAIKEGAEELFAALPAPAQEAVQAVLSFFQDTLLGGVLGVFERIKQGARDLVSIFGEGIYNLAFGRQLQAREAAGGGPAPAGTAAFRDNSKIFTPPSSTATTNNRRLDVNVNVQATGAGANEIAGQTTTSVRDALAPLWDELAGAHADEV